MSSSEAVTIALPSALTQPSLSQMQLQLVDALDEGCGITLNGADVARADAAGVQLLIAFFRAAQAEQRSASVLAPSEALRSAIEHLGANDLIPVETAATKEPTP